MARVTLSITRFINAQMQNSLSLSLLTASQQKIVQKSCKLKEVSTALTYKRLNKTSTGHSFKAPTIVH